MPSSLVTQAVLVIGMPSVSGVSTCTTIVTVRGTPTSSVPNIHVTTLPAFGSGVGPLWGTVAVTNVVCSGSVSVTTTPVALTRPVLTTVKA